MHNVANLIKYQTLYLKYKNRFSFVWNWDYWTQQMSLFLIILMASIYLLYIKVVHSRSCICADTHKTHRAYIPAYDCCTIWWLPHVTRTHDKQTNQDFIGLFFHKQTESLTTSFKGDHTCMLGQRYQPNVCYTLKNTTYVYKRLFVLSPNKV